MSVFYFLLFLQEVFLGVSFSPVLIVFAVLVLFVLFATLAIFIFYKTDSKPSVRLEKQDFPYSKRGSLFTSSERSFLSVLNTAVGDKVQIFGKVRVADVVSPNRGMDRGDWQRAFNKISAKHFDFVLCDKQDLSIICVVELNDSSHNRKARKSRDVFLTGVCKSASVPLVWVPVSSEYKVSEVRESFLPYIS